MIYQVGLVGHRGIISRLNCMGRLKFQIVINIGQAEIRLVSPDLARDVIQ